MVFGVIWTKFAIKKIKKIFNFYALKVSIGVAENITNGIIDATEILNHFPLKGEIEEYLLNSKKDFRHLVFKNYKIVYWRKEKQN